MVNLSFVSGITKENDIIMLCLNVHYAEYVLDRTGCVPVGLQKHLYGVSF